MAIHSRGRNRWRVRLWHRGIPHEWIVRGQKSDAISFEARKVQELEASEPAAVLRAVPKFSEFCATRYRPHAELHLRASSWYRQRFHLASLMEHFGDLKLTEIRTEGVEAYIRARQEAAKRLREISYSRKGKQITYKRPGGSIGAVAINNELRVLSRVKNFALERRVPIADFRVELLAEPERRPKVWTPTELDRLLAVCAEVAPEILPLIVFLANTGCRKGEALALTWDRVDLERGEVQIWPGPEWQPKNGKPREIGISDALLPWLSSGRKSSRWVFPSATGERFAFWPKRQFERACEAAGLSGGPHRLRHTFASAFLSSVPDLGLLAVILGHSDEAVTRLYAHMLPDRLARARNVVSVGPAVSPAVVAARQAWGVAGVQDSRKTGAETGARIGGARR